MFIKPRTSNKIGEIWYTVPFEGQNIFWWSPLRRERYSCWPSISEDSIKIHNYQLNLEPEGAFPTSLYKLASWVPGLHLLLSTLFILPLSMFHFWKSSVLKKKKTLLLPNFKVRNITFRIRWRVQNKAYNCSNLFSPLRINPKWDFSHLP